MYAIVYIEAKAKYAGNFQKLSTENVLSTTYLFLKGYIVESNKILVADLICAIHKCRLFPRHLKWTFLQDDRRFL